MIKKKIILKKKKKIKKEKEKKKNISIICSIFRKPLDVTTVRVVLVLLLVLVYTSVQFSINVPLNNEQLFRNIDMAILAYCRIGTIIYKALKT